MKLPYAEQVNYWKTGRSAPDIWIYKIIGELASVRGKLLGQAFGYDAITGHSAYMLQFEMDGEIYKIVWPVLPTRSGKDEQAARIQAVTMMYHDVKARCVSAKVLGKRAAFFTYFQLPDGRTAGQVAMPELIEMLPAILRPALPQIE